MKQEVLTMKQEVVKRNNKTALKIPIYWDANNDVT